MDSTHSAGRTIGVLIIVQLICTVILRVLQASFFAPGGFLVTAAPHATQIACMALLTLAIELLWLAVAVTAFPTFFERAPSLALSLLALGTVIVAAAGAEVATVLSVISVSEAYARGNAIEREHLEAVRVIVASARNGTFTVARLFDGAASFVLYAVLLRLALVPRWLAGFGVIAAILWMVNVAVTFFGHRIVTPLLAPLAAIHLILAVWLAWNGFRRRP